MLHKFFVRDRMVMVGLVVLGVATVAAGFVSGRSTFWYALSTDARRASIAWVERVERQMAQERPYEIEEVAGRPVRMLAPALVADLQSAPVGAPLSDARIARSVHEGSGLLAGIDRLFSGWISGLTGLLDADSHVSQVKRFALLDPKGNPVFRSADFTPSRSAACSAAPVSGPSSTRRSAITPRESSTISACPARSRARSASCCCSP